MIGVTASDRGHRFRSGSLLTNYPHATSLCPVGINSAIFSKMATAGNDRRTIIRKYHFQGKLVAYQHFPCRFRLQVGDQIDIRRVYSTGLQGTGW